MTKIAIVGGGLAGSCLAKLISESGENFHWYFDDKTSASHISSGILNPVTGRRYALAWKYDELITVAKEFYGEFIEPIRLEKHFSPFKDESSMDEVIRGKEKYLSKIDDEWINVNESFQLRTNEFIHFIKWRNKEENRVISKEFQHKELKFKENKWYYQDQTYDKVIFAEGIQVKHNPFFNHLPFKPNRGEALLIDIPINQPNSVKKHGKFICPFGEKFWVGSSFDNVDFEAPLHTEKAKQDIMDAIPNLVGHSEYNISDHLGAIRSTTPDRRPIVGEHLIHKGLYIFNGFGTKGTSLIPWCAHQLINFIYDSTILPIDIDIKRL